MSGFELPGHSVIRIEGRDAAAFLHAQLAGDVRTLADGSHQWNCYLTPQGRTQSVFVLARQTPELYRAHVPEQMAAAVVERLRRYVIRSKVAVAVEEVPEVDADIDTKRRLGCIARGIPTLCLAVADQFTPNALSLERLAAFSTTKGCYPGQEIVARTHFLGRSKRALARLVVVDGALPAPGTAVLDSTRAVVGTIVAAARADESAQALAVLHESALASDLQLDDSRRAHRLDFDQLHAS